MTEVVKWYKVLALQDDSDVDLKNVKVGNFFLSPTREVLFTNDLKTAQSCLDGSKHPMIVVENEFGGVAASNLWRFAPVTVVKTVPKPVQRLKRNKRNYDPASLRP